jgi:hypothetical protein
VLQNSKNGLQRFFREKSNQATIADRCVLKRVQKEFCNTINRNADIWQSADAG